MKLFQRPSVCLRHAKSAVGARDEGYVGEHRETLGATGQGASRCRRGGPSTSLPSSTRTCAKFSSKFHLMFTYASGAQGCDDGRDDGDAEGQGDRGNRRRRPEGPERGPARPRQRHQGR